MNELMDHIAHIHLR